MLNETSRAVRFITDFLALLAAWGTSPVGPTDFDGDALAGINDSWRYRPNGARARNNAVRGAFETAGSIPLAGDLT
ncbi:MAG: hypothetical protein ACYS15_15280 [Planctomycetota bacterium]|jgi:hypothetical protein